MKTTFKYRFYFTERTSRLAEKKSRSKTLELPRELFDHYDVDGMLKAFFSASNKFTYHDSNISVTSIKVGRTLFQI